MLKNYDEGWNATPEALRMSFKVLNNAGVVPPEVDLFNARAALRSEFDRCATEDERDPIRRRLAELEQRFALRLESLRINGAL